MLFDDTPPCAEDPGPFFPEPGHHATEALRICRGCGHREECLAEAMAYEGALPRTLRSGIYGGTTPDQRAAIARANLATDGCQVSVAGQERSPDGRLLGRGKRCGDTCVRDGLCAKHLADKERLS